MKHKVIRKARDVAIFGHSEATLLATIPILKPSPFPSPDIFQKNKSNTACALPQRIYRHRAQSKAHSKNRVKAVTEESYEVKHIRTKEDIIFLNRLTCTHKVQMQNYYRKQHLYNMLDKDAELFFILMFYSHELTDEELKKGIEAYHKLQRCCKDCLQAYCNFAKANASVLVFGQLVPETSVPDNKLLMTEEYHYKPFESKHRSSKNRKKKASMYRRAARKNKIAEQNMFLRDWIDDNSCDDVITLADV